MPSECFNR